MPLSGRESSPSQISLIMKTYTIQGITGTVDDLKKKVMWGTYGKFGEEPLKWVRLIDCSTDHLQAIISTQPHINAVSGFREVINQIIIDRS